MDLKNFMYKRGNDVSLDREFELGSRYGKVKLADETVFWKKGLKWYCLPLTEAKRAFRRIEAVDSKMCCGNVNFDIQKLVLILQDDTELELLIGEGTPREAELLYEKLQSKDCGLVFGKN